MSTTVSIDSISPLKWSPHFKGDIETIENFQRVFMRKLFRLCKLAPADYEHRLHFLGLQRLELRRIYFDLEKLYKITNAWFYCI